TITRTEDGGFIEVNDAFTLIAGYIREEALADSSLGLKLWANEEDRESVVADLRAGRAVEGREYQFRTKSGKNITGLFSAQIIKLSSGPCILSSINDITERKRAEEALRESESRFRALFETSADGILIVALETKIFKYANPSICRMLGYTENELITMNIADIHPKDALQSVMSEFEAQARGEKVLAESLPCIRKDGTIIYADVNAGKIIINGKAYIAGFFRDITERKRAEEVLRESETRFRLVWENSTDGMRITDKDGIIIMANDAYCTMVEKPPGEIEGKRVSIVYEKSQQNKLLRKYQERFRSGIIPPSLERDIILWNGKKMSFQLSNSFLEIPNQAKLLLSVLRDVTEQRRSEIALQESEVRYRSILQSANDAIVTADAEGTIVGWNTGAERMFGYSYVEAVGKLLTGMLPQPYLTEQRNDLNKPGSDIKPHHIDKAIELKGLHKDGTEFPVELSLAMWETNSKHFYTEIIRETSDRKRAEETQLLQTTALESTANGVVITDTSGTIAWVNTAFTEMTGYSFAESIGENPKILKSGGHNDAFYKSLWDTITAGNVWKGEIKNKRKDGTLYTEEMTITPVRDQRGKITHFVAIKQDISERKLVEEALRKSEERYRQFFEDDLTGVYVSTVEGKFISCNPAFVHMFGFSTTEDVFQVDAHSIYRHPEMRKAFVRRITEDKRLENLEMQYLRKDGTPLFCVENAVGIFDDKGALVHIRGYLFDDTKRRLLEDQLRQAQKMESLGTLTGGIAHDFNNILGIIIGHASLLNIQLPDNDVIKKNTDVITKTGMRGAALIKQMLAFARKTEIVFASVQLNNAITEIVKLLEETFPKTIRFTLDLEKDLPSIIGDSTQIHQVLLNLCVNARDAMSEKGEIAIRTNIMRDTRAKAKFFDAKDREYVSLSVSDTGAGMDEATLKRIFEPFFTTKERGKGTGLGLSVVYGIESAPGKGTTILIYFPLTDRRPALENTGGATIEEIPGGNETILFVEDEEALQILGTSTLESKGYKVLLASNGEEAVRMYEQHKDGIHLVLSDMGLPKISGHEIFQILKESNPNLRMILTSGFIEPELRSLILRNGVRDFIQKPYSPIELLRSIRSVLDLK
ncbi:MAG: PAS domain S-box protein, partial [Ignavibacteriales bacterium]|nr:PAS domain S-box protein [Ignavibacteriales bacterium]